MIKNEIYEIVVRLTTELAQTKVAEKIFSAVMMRDAVKAQKIIDAFPIFYPELYNKIVDFGKEFNKLVGDSEEDKEKFEKILEKCEVVMYNLADTKVIAEITKASESGDPTKLKKVIDTFKKDYSHFAEELIVFQKEFTAFRNTNNNGNEGAIFGVKADEENGIFVFDTNIIDALSFYVLKILANIAGVYFFCDADGSVDPFIDAIEEATNEAFAEFVASYNIVDWVGKDEEYQTIGEILIAAFADEFEEYVEE